MKKKRRRKTNIEEDLTLETEIMTEGEEEPDQDPEIEEEVDQEIEEVIEETYPLQKNGEEKELWEYTNPDKLYLKPLSSNNNKILYLVMLNKPNHKNY
mmetsp:Transcript_11022/g.1711  ORF Transcript_11022/g.1711 Transcript_11022/m.1711 type:complete len:98 (+) Transcript_11022:99-392(+)